MYSGMTTIHFVGAVETLIACLLSTLLIGGHLSTGGSTGGAANAGASHSPWCCQYSNPREQQAVVRIVAMVPVYSLNSFFSLLLHYVPVLDILFDGIKETYEAYAIYHFVYLMFCYLDVADEAEAARSPVLNSKLAFTGRMLRPLNGSLHLLIKQYTIVRPLLAFAVVALRLQGHHDVESHSAVGGTLLISQSLALGALVRYYHAFHNHIGARHRPAAKFLCVKGIVFLFYWCNDFRIPFRNSLPSYVNVLGLLPERVGLVPLLFAWRESMWRGADSSSSMHGSSSSSMGSSMGSSTMGSSTMGPRTGTAMIVADFGGLYSADELRNTLTDLFICTELVLASMGFWYSLYWRTMHSLCTHSLCTHYALTMHSLCTHYALNIRIISIQVRLPLA
jgi:hypothetical protein